MAEGNRRANVLHAMSGESYLKLTESASRHLFDGLAYYVNTLKQVDWRDLGFRSASPETQVEASREHERWVGYEFASGVLCGGILQLADTGLQVGSQNTAVPTSCSDLDPTKMAKYFVGREVCGLPLGVIVHAGRNQFAHWNDEHEYEESNEREPVGFRQFTTTVFTRLLEEHCSHSFMDLVYDLGNPFYGGTPIRAADLVVSTIRWHDYAQYEKDMVDMIGSSSEVN